MAKHILSVLVENHAGVLSRVAGLFSRRKFNIESLAVGVTENTEVSRITIVVDGDDYAVDQVSKQLNKLIVVKKVKVLKKEESVVREIAMIKTKADTASRSEVIQIVEIFRAKIVDVSENTLTIEVAGRPEKIDALFDMVKPFGVKEMVRTGTVAVERGTRLITDKE